MESYEEKNPSQKWLLVRELDEMTDDQFRRYPRWVKEQWEDVCS